jgi:4-amino-4-deoxy-L-arabinose transferase-like glycosyltransferase
MKQILKIAFALAVLDCGLALYLYLFNDDRLCLLLATSGSNFNSYYDGSGSRRAFGFSGYSIVTAGNAFFAFLYALWHGINSSGKTWWALLGAIALAALVLTQSRLYVLGGCASAAWILLRHRQASLLRTGFVACALLGVGLAGFSLLDVSDRLDILNHWSFADSDNGFEQHGVFHVDGINAVQENLLGHGPGYASAPDSSSESSGVRRAIVWTESTWLKLAVDEGVPFAILVLLLLGRALRVRPANTYDRSQKPFFALIILSFIGIGISFPIGLNLTNALIPCLLAGYLLRYDGLRHRGHIPQTGQGRGFRMLATR